MGRNSTYRHRTVSEAASIKTKTLSEYLISLIKAEHERSRMEAEIIALDAWLFLKQYHGLESLGQLEIPAVEDNEAAYFRRARSDQAEKLVRITLIKDTDADLLAEFGTTTMATGRMARIIEETYYQGALLDYNRLCLLFPTNVTAIRARLNNLTTQGARLPLAGLSKKTRSEFKALRPALALDRYLKGEKIETIRRALAISETDFLAYLQTFYRLANSEKQSTAEIAAETATPLALVEDLLPLKKTLRKLPRTKQAELDHIVLAGDHYTTYQGFIRLLQERHGYSPALAENFCLKLKELAKEYLTNKHPNQITYIAVSAAEGAGVSLKEATLKAVNLTYLSTEDFLLVNRESPRELKWKRIERFATEAYAQGAALNLPDLAYLLSVSVDAVRDTIKEHPLVLLPTRGRVADMGTTLSHCEKIIDLFVHGYTETEIKRRSGHSLDSIERYLLDFSKVVYLTESGLPLPALRQVTGFSKRLTEKYLNLYQRYSTKDFVFGMGKIRRFAQGRSFSKSNRKQGDQKDDEG